MFWHNLPDEADYASAQVSLAQASTASSGLTNRFPQYWRHRPAYPSQRTTVVRVDSSAQQPFSIVADCAVPRDAVSLIDGGHAELWVVVPASCKGRKDDLRTALSATEALSRGWKQRDFTSRTPYHVRPCSSPGSRCQSS